MSSTKAFLHLCRLNIDKPIESVINLQLSIHTIIFLFNLVKTYWCVAVVTCDDRNCFLTVYNSMPIQDTNIIQSKLPNVLDIIIRANSDNPH